MSVLQPSSGFEPIFREDARVLILGSLPGVRSLQQHQYYAHPQNVFWRILESVYGIPAHLDYAQRCQRVCDAGLAIWDVCASACRAGSLDTAIQTESICCNDIEALLLRAPHLSCIALNGGKAAQLFRKYVQLGCIVPSLILPSTSPAHAGMRFEEKLAAWSVLRHYHVPA